MASGETTEYTHNQLTHMKRGELESLAEEHKIAGHLYPNIPDLALAIFEAQGGVLDDGLTDKQEEFCQLFATDREFFGNATQAYMEAYEISGSAYQSAMTAASRLLTNVKILSRISELLADMPKVALTNEFVDTQLAFWVMQKAHPMASIQAIREYNRLTKRIDDKGAIPANLTQNVFNVSITDERGKQISEQMTNYMLEITKAPQEAEVTA